MGARLPVLPLLVVLTTIGCGGAEPSSPSPEGSRALAAQAPVLFDPQLVDLGFADLEQRFDVGRSALKLGSGWSTLEEDKGFAWARKRASVYFHVPTSERVDALVRCAAYHFDKAQPQRLVLTLNRQRLGETRIRRKMKTLRLPLPRTALRPDVNELELQFATATVPAAVGRKGGRQALAAKCERLAIVPREEQGRPEPARLESDRRRVTLTAGGSGLRLPLPTFTAGRLRLGEVRVEGAARLSLRVVRSTTKMTTREIWSGEAYEASGLELALPHRKRLAYLELAAPPSAEGRPGKVIVELPPDLLSVEQNRRQADQPNIFVYLIDTLRADALEPYGAERPTSPRLLELARDAVTFERAWSTAPWTLPATASLLTGNYPSRHGLFKTDKRPHPESMGKTLAARLAEIGYDTVGISQSYVASKTYGLDGGFKSFYLNDMLGRGFQRSGDVRWFLWRHLLQGSGTRPPLFAYLHTVAPHSPYVPQGEDRRFADLNPGRLRAEQYGPHWFNDHGMASRPAEVAHLRALYEGEVRYADRQLGHFIDLLELTGLYDESVIVVTSDHGEEFGEHGGFDHSRTVFEELLHVPLLIKFPRSWKGGTRVRTRVSLVDVAPTLLDLAAGRRGHGPGSGQNGDSLGSNNLDGSSLFALLKADGRQRARRIFAEARPDLKPGRYGAVELFTLTSDHIKCIHSRAEVDRFRQPIPKFRSYDLAADPGEQSPLDEQSEIAQRCNQTLTRWVERALDGGSQGALAAPLDDEAKAQMQALGYLN